MYKVYKYTNLINGKIYIGQTYQTLEQRAEKGQGYKGSTYFYNAIQKYGWSNFKAEILQDNLTSEEADLYEEYYIKLLDSTNPQIGYNLRSGGIKSTASEHTRKIISQNAKERYKDKTKNPMYGKKHSPESLKKMSESKKGNKNPMYGRSPSEEERKRISELYKKTPEKFRREFSKEEREKISERMKIQSQQWAKAVYCIEDNLYFPSITKAAEYYNVGIASLSGQLNGRQHTCKGRHFEFVNNDNV